MCWRTKVWHYNQKDKKYRYAEMKAWCRRFRHKYLMEERAFDGSFIVYYASK